MSNFFAPKGQSQDSPGQSGAAIAAERRPGYSPPEKPKALKGRHRPSDGACRALSGLPSRFIRVALG